MKKIALGTSNPHKLEEINEMLKDNIEFVLVEGDFDPDETGKTFEENSYLKAAEAAKIMNIPALADDTGLCVDALDGRPGIYSARYAPDQKSKIEKLLNELKDVPEEQRTAHFVCTMTLVSPEGEIIHSQTGRIDGFITKKPSGSQGFGYDPLFFVHELNKTMAEMTMEEKNTLSHRARALYPMIEQIKTLKMI
jgi:XTP/dITP diphosphohydrolase